MSSFFVGGGLILSSLAVSASSANAAAVPADGGQSEAEPSGDGQVVDGEYIVQLAPSGDAESWLQGEDNSELHARVEAVMAELDRVDEQNTVATGDEVLAELGIIEGFGARLSAESARKLAELPAVAAVYPNTVVKLDQQAEDPPVAGQTAPTWGLDRIDQKSRPLDNIFEPPNDGGGVHVYVVDGAILSSHREFARGLGKGVDLAPPPTSSKCYRHGTHVAGTAAGASIGVARNATLHSVRIFDCFGTSTTLMVLQGLDWVARNAERPAVVNMSFGGRGDLELKSRAVDRLAALGITSVAAAGNFSKNACDYGPASAPRAITVGASDIDDVGADFSNGGPCVDLYAPGVGVPSADGTNPSGYINADGTSMAAPHVTGTVALYLHDYPDATPAQVHDAIVKGAAEGQLTGLLGEAPNRLLNLQALPKPGSGGPLLDGPIAYITASETKAVPGSTTVFDGSGSIDPDGSALTYRWTVGGSSTVVGTGPTYRHPNTTEGLYTVSLTVTNADNQSDTVSLSVRVAPATTPPVAWINPSNEQWVPVGTTLEFDGLNSYDPDGGYLIYEWRVTGVSDLASPFADLTHKFDQPGRFEVELTVIDDEQERATTSVYVNVKNFDPPVAMMTPAEDQYLLVGQSMKFDGSKSYHPDQLRLSYEWRSTGLPGVVSRAQTYERRFREPGRFGVELTVTDARGGIAKKHINVWVTDPKPPVATFAPGEDQYVSVGTRLSFNGAASTDPDGGALKYEWRSTGLATLGSQTSSFSRTFDAPGRFGVELTVIDDEGDIAKKHINVWVSAPTKPPVAEFSPGTDQRVEAGTTLTFDGSGSNDPDGGALTYNWRSTGLPGVVAATTSYTRKFDQPGRFGVELTVIDDEGQVAKKHINVWVTAPPVAVFAPGEDQRVTAGQTLSFDGAASTDPDGGALKYEWRSTGQPGVVSRTNSYSRTFRERGRFGVELTVIDDEGQVAKKHINVWVS